MAAKGAFPIKVDSSLPGFSRVLKSAVCEWLLLFLLLLDAAFSYFLTKFAQYCELQLPCILCSRLDHILGKEKPDFYVKLLCSNHKLEISSLVSCHNHGKLVNIHGMCEECLLSFAKSESSEETYRTLMGKLGSVRLHKPLLNMGSLPIKSCSCCSKSCRTRPNVQKLLVQLKPPPAVVSNPEIPAPKSPGHRCLNSEEVLKKRRDMFSLSTKPLVLGATNDSLSHVGYTEVKINSDSDSDFPFSDDDELINVLRNQKKDEFLLQKGSKFTPKSQYNEVFPAVQHQKSTPATSTLMFPFFEPEKGETTTPRCIVSNGDARKGLEELNWQQLVKKASPVAPELVSLIDIPLSSSALKGSVAISAEGDRKKFDASDYSNFLSHKTALPSKNMQLPAKLPKENCIEAKEIDNMGLASATNHWESIDLNSTSTVFPSGKNVAFVPNNNSAINSKNLAPITIEDVQASSLLSEEIDRRGCDGIGLVEEPSVSKVSDLQTDSSSSNTNPSVNGHLDEPQKIEIPCSHESLTRPKSPCVERSQSLESLEESISEIEGYNQVDKLRWQMEPSVLKVSDPQTDSSSINTYPLVNGHLDEPQKLENPSSTEYLMPPKSPCIERSDSLESLEESVSEIDGESQVNKLRRQIQYDKKCIINLQKELEEERNASAIAANQAMAMMTKLQEEKAALNMEALQYLRMMEEQAEYDVDALEKAKDMIAEKEKEIQELEAELDYFRIKYPEDFPEMNEEILLAEDAQDSYIVCMETERS